MNQVKKFLSEDAVGYYSRIKHAEKGTEVIVLDDNDPTLVESNGKRFHVKKEFLTDIKPEDVSTTHTRPVVSKKVRR